MAAGRKKQDLIGDMEVLNDLISFNTSGEKDIIQLSINKVDKEKWTSFFNDKKMPLSAGVSRAVEYFITHVKNGDIELEKSNTE